jgi:hypothetical protein
VGKSRDTVRGIYAAFGKGDVPAVLGAFDARIEWREADGFLYADRNPYIGPQAILEGVFMRITGDVDDFVVSPEQFIEDGDTVAVEGRYRGTFKSTGKRVDAQFVHVWRLRDGKIARFQQYTDTKQWAEASR